MVFRITNNVLTNPVYLYTDNSMKELGFFLKRRIHNSFNSSDLCKSVSRFYQILEVYAIFFGAVYIGKPCIYLLIDIL